MRQGYKQLLQMGDLALQLGVRDFQQKYRSSTLGAIWALLQPLLVVSMFFLVFSVAFDNRWRNPGEPRGEFILALFAGFLVYNLFADIVGRSPTLIVGNVNYVKKLVFPLEIMPFVPAVSAVVGAAMSVLILLVLSVFIRNELPSPAWLLLPVLLLPTAAFAIGVSWALSAICAYFKDVAQSVPLALQALVFLSPVLYPFERIPDGMLRNLVYYNPLRQPIEDVRTVVLDGALPDFSGFFGGVLIGVAALVLGLMLFRRVKPGFADVV